jgi:hypothetical protein
MPALRTSLVALAVGGATVTAGLVATGASAAPVPVAAVSAATAGTTVAVTDTGADTGGAGGPVRAGIRSWWKGLTDEQRQCMEDADLRRPVGPLDDAERATLREQVTSAADGCGVELPFPKARAFWNELTDEQKQCLEAADLTRPVGPMTKEERRQVRSDVRAAAEKCGITLPERPAAAPAS